MAKRESATAIVCARAQTIAVALSRFATLFPYPMGGAPNARGARAAGAAILREVSERIAD